MANGVVCAPATNRDFAKVIEWAAQAGWNPGIDDASLLQSVAPRSVWIAVDRGVPVGAIAVIPWDSDRCFIGYFFVVPHYRGMGVGELLWQTALAYVGERTVELDAVPAQVPRYQRSGFVVQYRNLHMVGEMRYAGDEATPTASAHRVSAGTLSSAVRLDRMVFHEPRGDYVKAFLSHSSVTAFVSVDSGSASGLIAYRSALDGVRLGPLYAGSPATAQQLVAACALLRSRPRVSLHVPESSTSAGSMWRASGLQEDGFTVRMRRGPVGHLPSQHVFAVASAEMG
jgi:GNAT superfamily N-acetyltransferase